MTRERSAAVLATLGVSLFWLGVVVAGARAAGYSARVDVISELAGRGSSVAVLGIGSILLLVPVHAVVARGPVRTAYGSTPSALLLGAAAATAVIAVFPIGPAGADPDGIDLAHGLGVAAYAVLIVAAMLTVATRARGSALAPVSVLAGVASVTFLAATRTEDAGLWQRLWVGTNLGWLLVVAWAGSRVGGRRPGQE